MVIILSEITDYSTLEVIFWLNYFNVQFIRINSDDEIRLLEIDLDKNTFLIKVDGLIFDVLKDSMIWYRRGMFRFSGINRNPKTLLVQKQEDHIINYYVFKSLLLANINSLGNYLFSDPNKLMVLKYAREVGLDTPQSFVSGNKKKIQKLLTKDKFITKSLGRPIYYYKGKYLHTSYTEEINKSDLNQFDEDFFPSFVQTKVEKKFEIRTFFLIDKFYSMAIFSQQNKQTRTDFRKYDILLPNRTVPFKLPKTIENKLIELLDILNLNTASFDLIVNDKGQYVFLEVNPLGQFGMVSRPCNYFLEKKIAEVLSINKI